MPDLFIDLNRCIFGGFVDFVHKEGDEEDVVYPKYFPYNSINIKPITYTKPVRKSNVYEITPVSIPGFKGIPIRVHVVYNSTKHNPFKFTIDESVYQRAEQLEKTNKALELQNAQLLKQLNSSTSGSEQVSQARKIIGRNSNNSSTLTPPFGSFGSGYDREEI